MKRLLLPGLLAALALFAALPSGAQQREQIERNEQIANTMPSSSTEPPPAKKVPKTLSLHGEERTDPYFWLREKSNPDVTAYLDAENRYTDAVMKSSEPLQETLYREMLGRIKQTDAAVPFRDGGYFYYSRTEEGKQYPLYCRKKGSVEASEEIVLDLNALAEGKKFLRVGATAYTDDGRLLAYTLDTTGFREYELAIKDLRTGKLLPDALGKVRQVAWAADGRTLYYLREDAAKRPYRLYRHRLGAPAESDELLLEEKDELFRLGLSRSRSKAYLFVSSSSMTAGEVRAFRADEPSAAGRLILAREKDHEYDVDHHGDRFFIRTNDRGRNFRLVTAPVADPARPNWKEVLPHRADVMLTGIDLFRDHWIAYERSDCLPRMRVTAFGSGDSHYVEFPEPVYSANAGPNAQWDSAVLRFNYRSFITPNSVFDYDLKTRERKLLKRDEVLGGYDPALYVSERLYATAGDGTRVPISMVYRKDLTRDGSRPLYLNAYGSYGATIPIAFSSDRLSLLDRGIVYAWAHIRGGGDLGKPWHDQGRMLNKRNTFTDFIACAEHLVREKYTAPERLVISGGSAGGLLMGAVTNMRPELFKAVVSHVPFVDVINTMSDPTLPLTVPEYEEWGNPNVKAEYDYMKSYCPYTNLARKAYPSILVKTSLNDSQVMYWEPAKYVAKLRTLKTDRSPLLLKTNMAAGHGGASGRYDRLREIAFDYAFILGQLGIDK